MSESKIMDETRSVFRKPVNDDPFFRFEFLQHSGFRSKCLSIPEVSSSYEWSTSSVAGKNPKSPVYILALDKLKVYTIHFVGPEIFCTSTTVTHPFSRGV